MHVSDAFDTQFYKKKEANINKAYSMN